MGTPEYKSKSTSTSASARPRPWLSVWLVRWLVRWLVLALMCLLAGRTAAAPTVAVPVTQNFRFDGQHSDFTQQFYHRHLAGDVAPPLKFASDALPMDVKSELHQAGLSWDGVPGLLQRALLWDLGYAVALDNKITRIWTRCGRSMAQIFVPRKAYQRIGCTPKPCSVSTGEISYRHKWCDGDQAATISLCASEDAVVDGHSGMWGDGADADFIPEVNLVRHSWTDHNNSYLMFALHTDANEVAYNFCPARPSLIIPCTPLAIVPDRAQWCRPEPSKILRPWLQNSAAAIKPDDGWIMVEMMWVMMLFGSTIYGMCDRIQNRKSRKIRLHELELSLLANAHKDGSGSDAEDELEKALDAAAYEYLDSSVAITASAHHISISSSTGSSTGSSLQRQDSSHSNDSALDGADGRTERASSGASSIRLLSGHRSQLALRSFHLFESHHVIRKRRVPIRDIQFVRILSQGASGEVWLANLRGREVAVKQLLPTKRRLVKEMELFMAEIYLLSQLQHPSIIALVGVAWNTLAHVAMVQEWMERGDLQGFLQLQRKEGPTDDYFTWEGHKLVIAQSIASALAYLHSLTPQLLHRDVKSRNVLLSDAMDVKLCDFGISRRKHNMDEDDTNLTVTEAAGTMSWTAPEVLLGEDYGEKVDVYSFGIMLCEVDTCLLPYHDAESMKSRLIFHPLRLMKMVIQEGLRPALSPSCPPRIASLIHACLDGDPEKRPAAEEVMAYLSSEDIV